MSDQYQPFKVIIMEPTTKEVLYFAKCELHEYRVGYEAFRASLCGDRGTLVLEEEPEFEGEVKWDGCCNWLFAQGHYAHYCEPATYECQWRTIRGLYDLSGLILETAEPELGSEEWSFPMPPVAVEVEGVDLARRVVVKPEGFAFHPPGYWDNLQLTTGYI